MPAAAMKDEPVVPVSRLFAWIVFALSFGLLISDYMSRQVLNAVFPLLKAEWALSDAQLGALGSIVALMVGLLTFPLSLLADRVGRVWSLTAMAVLWSLATLGCALAQDYPQMLAARFLIGVGEAAYGSVGIAVVISVFPPSLRATLSSAFMAGGLFGSVLGMGLGGVVADAFGWRWSFAAMALFGLVLALLYPVIVRPSRVEPPRPARSGGKALAGLSALFVGRAVRLAYLGSGLQLFIAGAVMAWMPSFLNRFYGMAPGKAGATAAIFVLCGGVGMILCGIISDRLCRDDQRRKIGLAVLYCLASCLLLSLGFGLPPGPAQLGLLAAGMLVATGTTGPAGAMVANLTPAGLHGAAFATLTLANNILGLAPGPYLTGLAADHIGLDAAFRLVPLVSLAAASCFWLARRHYLADVGRVPASPAPALVA